MKRFSHLIIYLMVGIFSFLFFLYMLFPYASLKESVSLKLSASVGLAISIDDLGIKFPIGLAAYGVKVRAPNGKSLEVKTVSVRLSLLSLLMGRLGVSASVSDNRNGYLDVYLGFGLFSLLSGTPIPSKVELTSRDFLFGQLVSFGLGRYAEAPNTNPLLKPLLEGMDVEGKLRADLDLNLETKDFSQSKGEIDIEIDKLKISSLNNAMPVPNQIFSDAGIQGKVEGGVFNFGKKARFASQDLSIEMAGKAVLKPEMEKSVLDMQIALVLQKSLNDQLGILIYGITQKETDGHLTVMIHGPLSPAPEVTFQ